MLEIGDKAPNFRLKDLKGQMVERQAFDGKWLVVYFYPKDDTPGCTKEACDFTDALDEFRELHADIVGISADTEASHRKFTDKYGLRISLLSDPDKTVMREWGAWGMKKNYSREFEGVIRSTFIVSPDGLIAAKWQKVQVRMKRKSGEVRHSDMVRAKLEELRRDS